MKKKPVKPIDPLKKLIDKTEKWNSISGDKHRNPNQIWFPKSKSDLIYYRMMIKYCCQAQLDNSAKGKGKFFKENDVGNLLAKKGAITRPGVGIKNTVSEYKDETTANKPELSSFRMTNRIFRFLGMVIRHEDSNAYSVTPLGFQWAKFEGSFPSKIGNFSEKKFLAERLLDYTMFAPHDLPSKWDTNFKNRLTVNVLRCASQYGYITNNELVVTAFSLKKETTDEIKKMMKKLTDLHSGSLTMFNAFKNVSVDPHTKEAVTGAYDSPKVFLGFCRQVGFFTQLEIADKPLIQKKYDRMHRYTGKNKIYITTPRRINILTDYGKEMLKKATKKKVINFEDFL